MSDQKTRFVFEGMLLYISKDECGNYRFTVQDILDAIDRDETEIGGDKAHCLLRKSDGKVFAEIKIPAVFDPKILKHLKSTCLKIRGSELSDDGDHCRGICQFHYKSGCYNSWRCNINYPYKWL